MRTHPDDLTLLRWLDERVSEDEAWLTRHLATCALCRGRFDTLVDEAVGLRAAMALTEAEMAVLERANLPGRVVMATTTARATMSHPWQLLGLLALVVAMGAGWAALSPVVWFWAAMLGQTIALSGLALAAAGQVVGPLLATPGATVGPGALSVLGGIILGLGLYTLWSRHAAYHHVTFSL